MWRKAVFVLMVSAGLVAVVAPFAWAHHSSAAYESEKLISVEGVVTTVKWVNPHMFIEVAVPTKDGKTEIWGFEGSGTAQTIDSGITRDLLKVGNRVKIIAHPAKVTSKHLALFMGMEVNGKYYARGGGTNTRASDYGK